MTGLKRKRSSDDDEAEGGGDPNPPLPDEPLPESSEAPPLPDEPLPEDPSLAEAPPLPDEPVPSSEDEDESTDEESDSKTLEKPSDNEADPWQAIWDPNANAYYFYNSETKESTWLNPRLPRQEAEAYLAAHPPLIDPTAPPTIPREPIPDDIYNPETGEYGFTARFNARTGKFQNNPEHTAENFSTEGQIMRTAREYFDVSQMAEGKVIGQSGGALKSERKMMKIPKAQLKELIRRKREKKDRNKREWLRNDDIIVRKH